MELRDELIRLRESTGMNKKQFSEYFWNTIPDISGLGAWKTGECRNTCSALWSTRSGWRNLQGIIRTILCETEDAGNPMPWIQKAVNDTSLQEEYKVISY